MASSKHNIQQLLMALYSEQRKLWPQEGKHILAQFDEKSVVVYQAFKPSIAKYAVEHQCFGGPDFSFRRMSWIKTNFLWMMYRCGWASKPNQERVLAVRITREGFDEILRSAFTAELQKQRNITSDNIMVRLQWDPDHKPNYDKENRRAIQLGLKGEILRKYSEEWMCSITDITDYVHAQHQLLQQGKEDLLETPIETIYPVEKGTALQIDLDEHIPN